MCCDSMGDGVDFGRIVLGRIDIDTKATLKVASCTNMSKSVMVSESEACIA